MLAVVVAALLAVEAPATPAPSTTDPAPAPAANAAPAPKARTKLLVLDLQSSDLEPSQRETLTGALAARAARFRSLDVISSIDLRQLADLRANQAAAGCDDASASCMAELAHALGAELVLASRAGKLDAVTVVTLQLFNVADTTAEGRASVQGWSLVEVSDQLGPAVDELLERATGEKPEEARAPSYTAAPRPEASSALSLGLWVGGGVAAGVGILAGVFGAVPALLYEGKRQELVKLTAAFDGSAEQLGAAQALQREANQQRDTYNNLGRFGVIAGAVLVPLGAAAVAAAFFLPAAAEGSP